MKIKLFTAILFFYTSQVFGQSGIVKCMGINHNKWDSCVGSIAIDGTAYVGDFKNGQRDGIGSYTYFKSKKVEKGLFKSNKYIGKIK